MSHDLLLAVLTNQPLDGLHRASSSDASYFWFASVLLLAVVAEVPQLATCARHMCVEGISMSSVCELLFGYSVITASMLVVRGNDESGRVEILCAAAFMTLAQLFLLVLIFVRNPPQRRWPRLSLMLFIATAVSVAIIVLHGWAGSKNSGTFYLGEFAVEHSKILALCCSFIRWAAVVCVAVLSGPQCWYFNYRSRKTVRISMWTHVLKMLLPFMSIVPNARSAASAQQSDTLHILSLIFVCWRSFIHFQIVRQIWASDSRNRGAKVPEAVEHDKSK